ncbi:peptide chain release factor N(5)-glutamine methyltransferase [Fulvivirga kasyanovii]|uniref:Release factor glutamine methyltransferase n=1 Tax=Fulvivirga kasyanovii TaxID=396812 RepID=A0ABW9RR13_9BACT|nr:peptide chain release factor N(5)-glutamine methyltransferase [Fulvivirga kasyanovii]MTI26320.1 peptide chain release factor N(5)-glutamine methyltransferase [Fulvivirga kasyanovii]
MSRNIPDSSKKLLKYITDEIHLEESAEEVLSIAYLIMEHVFGLDKAEIILDRSINISNSKAKELKEFIKRINTYEPIQYILGETEFYGREFKVDKGVLIPRGETEELVQLIINENQGKKIKLLDIGTGTGCIPITLLKELRGARAFAIDYDPRAIKVARKNAQLHNVPIEFLLIDILNEPIPVQSLDVIVSNPPYVTESDKLQMKPNVLKYEPAMALFVEDSDPLLYYRRIAELAKSTLKEHGLLYFEINERFGEDVKTLLEVMDYSDVQIVKDLHGKDRIARASNSVNVLT